MTLKLEKDKVALSEPVALEIIVKGSLGGLGEPKIAIPSELSLLSQSKSQKIEIINWRMTTNMVYTLVLSAPKAGIYKLGPASLDVGGGQVITASAVVLEVADQKSASSPAGTFPVPFPKHKFPRTAQEMLEDKQVQKTSPPPGSSPTTQSETSGQRQAAPAGGQTQAPPLVFVEAKIDKETAFVGQPVKFSVLFYSRVPFVSQPQYMQPAFSGFWHEELVQKTFTANIRGASYQVTEIPSILFPTISGKLGIGPAKIQVELEDVGQDPFSMDPFDPQFLQRFFSMGTGQARTIQTNPISVTAKPLPEEGRPRDFSGAVGRFDIKASLDKTDIKVGESLTLTVAIAGEGNIRSLPSPSYPNLEGIFRSYETEKSETISKDKGTIEGQKIYKLLLIPQIPGHPTLAIPSIKFTYFDPESRQYVRRETPALHVKVSGEPIRQIAAAGTSAKEAKKLGEDIEYIVEEVPAGSSFEIFITSIAKRWPIGGGFPVVLGLTAFLVQTIRKKRLSIKGRPVERLSDAISQAQHLAKETKFREAFNILAAQLETAVSDLSGLNISKLTAKTVIREISRKSKNIPTSELQLLQRVLENLNFLRFAPIANEEIGQVFSDVLGEVRQTKKILEKLK